MNGRWEAIMKRYLVDSIREDLREKLVFLGGPRQVGKTTLALGLIKGADESHPAYLSWDVPESQRLLLAGGRTRGPAPVTFHQSRKHTSRRTLPKGASGH